MANKATTVLLSTVSISASGMIWGAVLFFYFIYPVR